MTGPSFASRWPPPILRPADAAAPSSPDAGCRLHAHARPNGGNDVSVLAGWLLIGDGAGQPKHGGQSWRMQCQRRS